MCTASIIRFDAPMTGSVADRFDHGSIVRLAFSRDELLSRPPARLPELFSFGQRRAIMPVDPISNGTWIAINDAGLAFAILNRNSAPRPVSVASLSRGLIIPRLLHCSDASEVESTVEALPLSEFGAFRLLLLDGWALVELTSDGSHLRTLRYGIGREPLMFTSSGLGDALVTGPRRELLWEYLRGGPPRPQRQDEFHRHRWPDRPHLSVCMSRPDARTVSYTVVELTRRTTTLTYHAGPPVETAPVTQHMFELRRRQAA